MRTASFFLDKSSDIFNFMAVDDDISTDFFSQSQLVIVDINSDNMGIKDFLGILHRQVTQSTCSKDNCPLAWLQLSFFDSLVGSHAGTSDRRSLSRIQTFRDFDSVVSCYDTLLCHPTINRITSIFYCTAKGFAASCTVFTSAAAFKEPCNTDAVSDFETFYIWSDFFDNTDTFMSENATRYLAKVTMRDVQIRMAATAVFDINESFPCFKRTKFLIFDELDIGSLWIYNNCFHKQFPPVIQFLIMLFISQTQTNGKRLQI